MISIETNADEVAADFNTLAATLESTVVNDGIEPFLKSVQVESKRHHRFHARTGKLTRSVKISADNDGGSIYIDDASAPYGKYIHDGTRRWSADPFVQSAYESKQRDLDVAVDRALDNAITKAGL
jgi:hypothetical protein